MTIGKSIVITAGIATCFAGSFFLTSSWNSSFVSFSRFLLIHGLFCVGLYAKRKRNRGIFAVDFSVTHKKVVLPMVIVSMLLTVCLLPLVTRLPAFPSWSSQILQPPTDTMIFAVLTAVVLAPILEELIFRGIILDGLLETYSPNIAIFVTSLLFGIYHLNLIQFIYGFIIGIFLGWVYYHSKSLSLPMLIHAVVNATGLLLMNRWITFDLTLGAFLVLILGLLTVFILCLAYIHREFRRDTV